MIIVMAMLTITRTTTDIIGKSFSNNIIINISIMTRITMPRVSA